MQKNSRNALRISKKIPTFAAESIDYYRHDSSRDQFRQVCTWPDRGHHRGRHHHAAQQTERCAHPLLHGMAHRIHHVPDGQVLPIPLSDEVPLPGHFLLIHRGGRPAYGTLLSGRTSDD